MRAEGLISLILGLTINHFDIKIVLKKQNALMCVLPDTSF